VSSDQDVLERLIWATRGRSWGFRFLADGGLADPLLEYERIFAGLGDEPTAWRRLTGNAALRFPDPEGRRDAAGRVIPHEFVVPGDLANDIQSAEEGQQQVWPLVAVAYARVWDAEGPPSATDLRFAIRDDTPLDVPRSTHGDGDTN
jgi:hypothetical protein